MKKVKVDFIARFLICACILLAGTLWFSGSAPGTVFFLDPASLIVVVLGAAAMTLMGFSIPEIGAACRHARGSAGEHVIGGLEKSKYVWEAIARNFFQAGVLMTVIGFVIMMKSRSGGLANVWRTLAICFITTLYGLIFAAFSAIAGLRVGKNNDGFGALRQEMQAETLKRERHWNIERIIGIFLFIATFGWAIQKADALTMFIHWPSLLIVAGGAILFVLWAGNGADGFSTTLGFVFTGVIGIVFGLVHMFYGALSIEKIGEGMTFAILSCVFALAGMMLGGAPRQDHAFMAGKAGKKTTFSRFAWYGFPAAALLLLLYIFVLMLIPIVTKN